MLTGVVFSHHRAVHIDVAAKEVDDNVVGKVVVIDDEITGGQNVAVDCLGSKNRNGLVFGQNLDNGFQIGAVFDLGQIKVIFIKDVFSYGYVVFTLSKAG